MGTTASPSGQNQIERNVDTTKKARLNGCNWDVNPAVGIETSRTTARAYRVRSGCKIKLQDDIPWPIVSTIQNRPERICAEWFIFELSFFILSFSHLSSPPRATPAQSDGAVSVCFAHPMYEQHDVGHHIYAPQSWFPSRSLKAIKEHVQVSKSDGHFQDVLKKRRRCNLDDIFEQVRRDELDIKRMLFANRIENQNGRQDRFDARCHVILNSGHQRCRNAGRCRHQNGL